MPKRQLDADSDSDWSPNGQENVPPENERPVKRRRTSAKKTKRTKKPAPPKFTKKKFADLKRPLNEHVKTFYRMVDRDWHDGYEEQSEELVKYFQDLREPFQTIYDFARVHRRDYGMCHELLKYIADTWERLKKIPARIDHNDVMTDSDADWDLQLTELDSTRSFSSSNCMRGLLSYFWPLLLLSVCADENAGVSTEDLNQWIRDAKDFGVEFDLSVDDVDEENGDLDEYPPQAVLIGLRDGVDQLSGAIELGDWRQCPTTKKNHPTRRIIDRRFDGPKHLRTRNYSDDEDDFGIFGSIFGFYGF